MPRPPLPCEVCSEAKAKYTCPGCDQHTCSVTCVNKHKVNTGCDGQRDKTKYIKVNNFTDLDLLNDYRFLEDASRKADSAMRDKLKRRSHKPKHLTRMVYEARKRRVNLRLMPYPMNKRLHNKTYYQYRKKAFFWHVEWVFPVSQMKHSQRLPETMTLRSAVNDLLSSDLRHRLPGYTKRDTDQLVFLMRAEEQPSKLPKFYQLDSVNSLAENFAGKTIIEYPSVHVVYSTEQYDLIDTDGADIINSDTRLEKISKPDTKMACESDVDTGSETDVTSEVKTDVSPLSKPDVETVSKPDDDSESESESENQT